MPVPSVLLPVLADPVDHGPLELTGSGLLNPRRSVVYPVRDDVAVLLAEPGVPAAFDGIAGWYDEIMQDPGRHGAMTDRVNTLVADELGKGGATATALDVACGTGLLPRWLGPLGWTVLGTDYSAGQLAIARERLPVVQADAAALPFRDDSFDAVVTTFSAAPDEAGAAREAHRVLRAGGRYVTVMVHPVLNGSLSRRAGDGSVTVLPGYERPARFAPDGQATSVRGRAGASHRPLGERLTALLGSGLRLTRFLEFSEYEGALPSSILSVWTKDPVPAGDAADGLGVAGVGA